MNIVDGLPDASVDNAMPWPPLWSRRSHAHTDGQYHGHADQHFDGHAHR